MTAKGSTSPLTSTPRRSRWGLCALAVLAVCAWYAGGGPDRLSGPPLEHYSRPPQIHREFESISQIDFERDIQVPSTPHLTKKPDYEVLDSSENGQVVAALVRQTGALPWVRVEARFERELIEQVPTESLIDQQSLAADRVEVRLKAGAPRLAIVGWLEKQGARLVERSGTSDVFEVIWLAPKLDTVPKGMNLLASVPDWFAHVRVMPAPFDRQIFQRAQEP